jgi:hypothetical protein
MSIMYNTGFASIWQLGTRLCATRSARQMCSVDNGSSTETKMTLKKILDSWMTILREVHPVHMLFGLSLMDKMLCS